MSLFRAIYIRQGRPHGMTFTAHNPAFAAEFAYTVLERYIKALCPLSEILTVKAVVGRPHCLIDTRTRGCHTPPRIEQRRPSGPREQDNRPKGYPQPETGVQT